MTKKCTKTLITAVTSQMNGGKAMTPALSEDAYVSVQAGCRGKTNCQVACSACPPRRANAFGV